MSYPSLPVAPGLVPRALSLSRRTPPPLWETSRAANQTVTGSASQEGFRL